MPCELDDAVMYHSDLLCSLLAFFLQVLEILLADSLQLSASFRKIACPVALSPRLCLLFQGGLCARLVDMCILRLGPFDQIGSSPKGRLASELPLELTKASVGTASWLLSFPSILLSSHIALPHELIPRLLPNTLLYADHCLRSHHLEECNLWHDNKESGLYPHGITELLKHYILLWYDS